MTQVNPIWAQVHTVDANGKTTFLDDVEIDGTFTGIGQEAATFTISGATTTQGQAHIRSLVFSGLTADYAGLICALDGSTTTDTGTRNYTGKLRGTMGHVIVQTSGGTIATTEGVAGVVIVNPTAVGTMTDGFGTGGEIIHGGPAGYTVTNFTGVRGQIELTGAGNIGTGYGTYGIAYTDAASTGTYTTAMVGAFGLAQHNTTAVVNRAVGGQFNVGLTAAGTVTTNAIGVQAYMQSASTATVTGNAIGIDAWAAWGSSTAQTNLYGGQFHFENTGGATVANGEGIHVGVPTITGGAVTKGRGIRISNQGASGVTTAEGLHIDNQTGAGTNIAIITAGGLHQFVTTANVGVAWTLTDGTTTLYAVDTRNTNGGLVGTHQFLPTTATIASAGGTLFTNVAAKAYTLTLTGGTGVNSLSGMQVLVSQPTVTSASATAVTGLSSVSIAGPPILGGSVTTPAGGNSSLWVGSAIATVAGGALASGIAFGLTSNAPTAGIYWGSGAPTISAPQGSLYIRTDGSSTSTRLYVNTTGSTTWTNVTTAA